MPEAIPMRRKTPSFWLIPALLLAFPVAVFAQAGQRGGAPAAGGARGAAPVDLTGYWVS
ncbi:MAG: hypothetical protein HYU27_06745, partial [Acidobacteria bacterium]|nr:hypothetical protein [Acidobacteriota bacterium]